MRLSQKDTLESSQWRETLGGSLGSHDVLELVGGRCHSSSVRKETTCSHVISCSKGTERLDSRASTLYHKRNHDPGTKKRNQNDKEGEGWVMRENPPSNDGGQIEDWKI